MTKSTTNGKPQQRQAVGDLIDPKTRQKIPIVPRIGEAVPIAIDRVQKKHGLEKPQK